MWQDIAITIIIYAFAIGMIPLVKQVFKEGIALDMRTNLITVGGNFGLMVIWITFPEPLWISFSSSMIIGIMWLLITIGSYKNRNKQ